MAWDYPRIIVAPDGQTEKLPAKLFYENLSWLDVKEMPDKDRVIIAQPLGSTEQHGPHGPLDMDSNNVRSTVPLAAHRANQRGARVLVAPLIPYGWSVAHFDEEYAQDELPGTISISSHTYISLLTEVCTCFARAGFRRIALITGHGQNTTASQLVGREVRYRTGALVAVTAPFFVAGPELGAMLEQGFLKHAEEFETSVSWATDEESINVQMLAERRAPVDMEAPKGTKFFARDAAKHPGSAGKVFLSEKFSEASRGGVQGDPHLASKEKGERFIAVMVDKLAEFFEFFAQIEFGKGRDVYIQSTLGSPGAASH